MFACRFGREREVSQGAMGMAGSGGQSDQCKGGGGGGGPLICGGAHCAGIAWYGITAGGNCLAGPGLAKACRSVGSEPWLATRRGLTLSSSGPRSLALSPGGGCRGSRGCATAAASLALARRASEVRR